jgi:hypothetical protein
MEDNDKEEKRRLLLEELLPKYIEMGEEIHKLEMELDRLWKEPVKWREEFMAILKPAGFYVEFVEKLVRPHREVYSIVAMRMMDKEKDYL